MLTKTVAYSLRFLPKGLVRPFAKPYVAGETLTEVLEVVQGYYQQGIATTVDVLGEACTDARQARLASESYHQLLDRLGDLTERLEAPPQTFGNVSLKLSQFGLNLDPAICRALLRGVVAHAADHGQFIRLDMENSTCTSRTLELFLELRRDFKNVGLVLQAYLRRSRTDLRQMSESLAELGQTGHYRLCKGIYQEPRVLAFQQPELIWQNYLYLLETMLSHGAFVGIATHDETLVWHAERLLERYRIPPDRYEFQMLHGVDPQLRGMLRQAGHPVRVYVPFGPQWHAYCMRRFAENPRILGYVLKNLMK